LGFHSLDDLHEEMAGVLAAGGPAEVGLAPRGQSPPNPESREATPTDELLLFSYPLLVDEGTLSAGADRLKEALEEQPFVEVHTEDAEQLGIGDGDTVRLRTPSGEAAVPVRVTDGIGRGVVFLPWNQPGLAANTLLAGSAVTTVTLEPVATEVPA
jgi:anaerobic selenocysteine-containing dehydrogenase